jgi:hypothetical protein
MVVGDDACAHGNRYISILYVLLLSLYENFRKLCRVASATNSHLLISPVTMRHNIYLHIRGFTSHHKRTTHGPINKGIN